MLLLWLPLHQCTACQCLLLMQAVGLIVLSDANITINQG